LKKIKYQFINFKLLCTILFWSCASNSPYPFKQQDVIAAQKLYGVEFNETEIDTMMKYLVRNRASYDTTRTFNIEYNESPAMTFNPLPNGFTTPSIEQNTQYDLNKDISIPENYDGIAFYSIFELASLIQTKQITSEELTNFYLNTYRIVIGKMFSVTQLGFYNQADTLRMFPVSNLTATLQKVTYPMFSVIQDDEEKLKDIFSKITGLVFYVVCPVMFILTLIAEPLFITLLTTKWIESVPYFQILALSSVVYPLSIYNLNIILVKGRTDLHLKMEVLKKVTSLMFLFLIIPFGIWGVILAQAISMFIHFLVNAFYCGKLLNFPLNKQILSLSKIIFVNLIIAFVIYCLIYLTNEFYNIGNIIEMIIVTFIYLIVYFIISKLLDFKELEEIEDLLRKGLKKIF